MPSYSVVCFDYYGTLVKIGQPFLTVQQWIAGRVGSDEPVYAHMLRNYAKLSSGDIYIGGDERLIRSLKYACGKFGLYIDIDEFSEFVYTLFASPAAYPDAHETIRRLKQYCLVGVTSNADNHIINASIEANGFDFDFLITSEDSQSDKPSRQFFSHVENKLSVPKENMVIIGDSWKDDIWGAGQYGLDSIWVNREQMPHKSDNPLPIKTVSSLSEAGEFLRGAL